MDRFIEFKKFFLERSKNILKSNMDRFIERHQLLRQREPEFLKSNMDRFIVINNNKGLWL